MSAAKPIIVIKKKGGHGGHHGGAWKVAYADFVTAMMALFIVLWLLNSSQKVQKAVGGYFRDPSGTAEKVGSDMSGVGENFVVTKDNMEEIKEQLEKTIREVPDFEKLKNNIDMTVTNEGLRIELTESAAGTFFDSGSTKISSDGIELLGALGSELGKLPNTIAMEGHTDSKPYSAASTYTNWELSSDRANAARRLMLLHGIRNDQVTQVRGFADRRLRQKDNPLDPSNRRISLIVQYLPKKPGEADAKGEKGAEGAEGKSEPSESKSKKPESKSESKPAEKK
ncbi:MAG TPA: flagellar motor protein MotB [Candidatus Acidoferrum sp.]|jgi:chemotaxis protein MotB